MARNEDFFGEEYDWTFDDRNIMGWDNREFHFIENLPNFDEVLNDSFALNLINAAYMDFDSRTAQEWRDLLSEYWQDEFGYDFDDYFDWEGWREWISPTGTQ